MKGDRRWPTKRTGLCLLIAAAAAASGCGADLTQVFKPRAGNTNLQLPASMMQDGTPTSQPAGTFAISFDPEKEIVLRYREYHEDGSPKKEFDASGSRVPVIQAAGQGIYSIEGQRYEYTLRSIELALRELRETVTLVSAEVQALKRLQAELRPPTAGAAGPGRNEILARLAAIALIEDPAAQQAELLALIRSLAGGEPGP